MTAEMGATAGTAAKAARELYINEESRSLTEVSSTEEVPSRVLMATITEEE